LKPLNFFQELTKGNTNVRLGTEETEKANETMRGIKSVNAD
jgi:hypothetical protein